MHTAPNLLTTSETADALRISPATLRKWTKQGKVPCVRLSDRVVRYQLAAVLEALGRQQGGGRRGQ